MYLWREGRVFGLTQWSQHGRTSAVRIFKRWRISKFREHKQGLRSKRKKPKPNQVSLLLKRAEILYSLASSKHGISWTPVALCHYWSAVCQGKEELKLSKAVVYQANQQCAAYLHVKRSTCQPPNHFKRVWRSFHSTCLHLFCLCLCFSLPPEKCSRFAHGLHGSRGIELILSHETFANRSRFAILFFPLCPSTPFQKVLFFSAVTQHNPSLLLRTGRSLGLESLPPFAHPQRT